VPVAPTSVPAASIGSFGANVISLLHFDGTTTDEKGRTWTANNSATTSASAAKFGAGGLSLLGATDYISTPDSADLNFGTSDFTIDYWVNDSVPSTGIQFWKGNAVTGGHHPYVWHNSDYLYASNGSSYVLQQPLNQTANIWTHMAISRSS